MIAVVALGTMTGCGRTQAEGPPVGISKETTAALSDRPVVYAFDPVDDERPVSTEAHRGKPVVLAFVTTGDIVCQAQIGFLNAMAKNDGDRVAYAVVALHPRREIVLVDAYRSTLGITFPVALGDASTTAASVPFGEIPAVPTVVVLDRFGKIVWKHTGLAKADEIRARLRYL